MKKMVMYGAGNIGRGFIGALFSQAGYEITFVDVVKDVVENINRKKAYTVRIVSGTGYEDQIIAPVRAVDGTDANAVAEAIAGADIMATAVGAKILKFIAPNIAEGVRRRAARGGAPLNILICENLMDADKYLRDLLLQSIDETLLTNVGLVEASIGRMVPVQTEQMRAGDPLRVCVERYGSLPVDKDAFVGDIPDVKNMHPFSPFHFYLERKLYVHNMGHAVLAYLGLYTGKTYIYECVADPRLRLIAQNAMLDSALSLCAKYGVPATSIKHHVDDLLLRFANAALGDTCARVGADIPRKLAASDRLVGASLNILSQGEAPSFLAAGIAAALYQYLKEQGAAQSAGEALCALKELSGLPEDGVVAKDAMTVYQMLLAGADMGDVLSSLDAMRASRVGDVI